MANLVPSSLSQISLVVLVVPAVLACALLGGCEIEGRDACDANQVFVRGGTALEYAVCVCDEASGWVFDEVRNHGCRQCAAGQDIVAGRCVTPAVDAGAMQADGAAPRALTGVGAYCDTEADCASFDAKFCTPTHMCLLQGCASGQPACTVNTSCCDFSQFLAGFSLCLPNEQLTDGNCPMGGTKVSP